ncbi:putative uncharacterized protein [Mycolicibacterium canariasense]|uniref:Uncharacterized protein n=1 Tax=Mycolicibacterium canariasense TaxID=228230 RepID=A0A117IBZ9_MYCCR|nr:putative uncharacterized protein [Mycolicibacterium canariasense]
MPDVEIGLGSVLGDEHLTVLERVHGARVHVEIRVELLHGHLQTASGEQLPETTGRQAFTERRSNATTDEKVLRRGVRVLA